MDFEIGPAILAGLIAGALMEGPVYMQKALGLPVKQNIFQTWAMPIYLTACIAAARLVNSANSWSPATISNS